MKSFAASSRDDAKRVIVRNCKHKIVAYMRGGTVLSLRRAHLAHVLRCLSCWSLLPFGLPANITPEVAIEIRAAEIAAAIADGRTIVEVASRIEDLGWWSHEKDTDNALSMDLLSSVPDTAVPGLTSGWLARQIAFGDDP